MSGGGGYRGRGFVPQGHRRQGIDGSRGPNSRSGCPDSRSPNTGYSRLECSGSRSGGPVIAPRSKNSSSRSFGPSGRCDGPNSRPDGPNSRPDGPNSRRGASNFRGNAGGSAQSPHPNFNLPRRLPRHQPRQSDSWSPHGAPQRGFVPWQGGRPPRFNTRPPYFRGRGQNQFLPYRYPPPPIATNYPPPPILEYPPIVEPQKPQTPHLGSEEERLQKITEAADKLKRKLSSVPKEPYPWYNDNEDTAIALSAFDAVDDARIMSRGIPELKHDPPELNLTLSDLRDIGRVDQDHTGKTAKASVAPSQELDDQEVMILEHEPVQRRIPAATIDIDFWPDDNCLDYASADGTTHEGTVDATEVDKIQENFYEHDQSSMGHTNKNIADDSRFHEEDSAINSNEIIDKEIIDETGSKTFIDEPIMGDSTEAEIDQGNEMENEFCRDNVEGEMVETRNDGRRQIEEEMTIDYQGDEKCIETRLSGDENRMEDNAMGGEIYDERLAGSLDGLQQENEPASEKDKTKVEISAVEKKIDESTENLEKLDINERMAIGEKEKVTNDTEIEETREILSQTRDTTEINDKKVLEDESINKNTNDTKNHETKGKIEILHVSQDKESSEIRVESETVINPEKIKETREEMTSDIDRTSVDETSDKKITQECQVELVKDETSRETLREMRDDAHSELSCDNEISERQQNEKTKSHDVAINESRNEEYPARQTLNEITERSVKSRKNEDYNSSKHIEQSDITSHRSDRVKSTRDRISKTEDPDKTERTLREDHKKELNDNLRERDKEKSADYRDSQEDSLNDHNICERRKLVRKMLQKSSNSRDGKSLPVDSTTRALTGDFYGNESPSSTISSSSIAFDPRGLPPLMNSYETTNYGISTQRSQDSDESLQLPLAFDPRFTTTHDPCVLLSTSMPVGQDFTMSSSYPSCTMPNLVPNVAPLNYGVPATIMRPTIEPNSNVQSMCINDPYTPLMSMPSLSVVAPIVLPNDMILQPPLPADPPPPPPMPGKSCLDMMDELGDMQEAMEFAKQFMNMSETAGAIDGEINDPEDSDNSDIFHMPTFPDLPPIELPPLPPLPPAEPKKIVTNPHAISSRELKRNSKKHEGEVVTYGPEPMPEEHRKNLANQILLDEARGINDEQLRPKVVFNLSSKTRKISKHEDWQHQQIETIEAVVPATITTEIAKNRKNKLSAIPSSVIMTTTGEKLRLNGHEERKKHDEKTLGYNGKLEQARSNCFHEKRSEVTKSSSSSPSGKLAKCLKELTEKSNLVEQEKNEIVPRQTDESSKTINDPQTPESSWKSRVIGRFLKMSKNDICNMLNNTGLRKFDIAMKHLVKERRILGVRSNEEKRNKDFEISYNREEFMDQLSAMLDPSATVDVCNLPTQFIHHLSEVLQLDTLEFEAALGQSEPRVDLTLSESKTPPKIIESRREFREPDIGKNTRKINDHRPPRKKGREKNSISTLSGNAVSTSTPAAAVVTTTSLATSTATTPKPKIPQTRELPESLKCEHPSVEKIVEEPVENRMTIGPRSRRRRLRLKSVTQQETAMSNGTPTRQTDANLLNMADVDDIFSAGIARAKKKNVFLATPVRNETEKRERNFMTDERRVMIVKEPSVDRVERAAVELDEIFTAGIARAKLASKKAAAAAAKAAEADDGDDDDDEENPEQSWNQIDRHVEHRRIRQKSTARFAGKNDNKWCRRKALEDPDAFRNLTKEEWEAKQSETSYMSYQRECRAMMETRACRVNSSLTDVRNDSTKVIITENVSAKSRLGEPVQASGGYDNWDDNEESGRSGNNEETIENQRHSNDTSSSVTSSTSSSDASEKEQEVTKLLKVIKEREKIAKKKSINEEIRDEVTAEIERKRRERDQVRKRHKTRTKKSNHHRRKRDKKDKSRDRKRRDRKRRKRKSRRSGENSCETSDNEDADEEYTSSASRGLNSRNLLTDDQIKKEIIIIKDEPAMEIATASTKRGMKSWTRASNDDSRPPSTASSSSIPSVIVSSAPSLATMTQQPKTKAQLKQMPEIIAKNSTVGEIFEEIGKNRETPMIEDSRGNKKIKADTVTSSDSSSLINEFNDRPISTISSLAASSLIVQQGTTMSDDASSVSRSISKKLDIKTYKERARQRLHVENEKLRLMTENPSSLTQDLLNIPLMRKKQAETREEIGQKIVENSTETRNEESSRGTIVVDKDIISNAMIDSTTIKNTEIDTAALTSKVSISQSDSSQEITAKQVVRKKIIRRPLITTSMEKSTTNDLSTETGKFAHIKSEGGKELKLREKLRRGYLRNSTESPVTQLVVNKRTQLKRRRSVTDPGSTKELANLTEELKTEHVPLSKNMDVSMILDVSKDLDVSKNVDVSKNLDTLKSLDQSESFDTSINLDATKTLDSMTDNLKKLDTTMNLDESKIVDTSKNVEISKNVVDSTNYDTSSDLDISKKLDTSTNWKISQNLAASTDSGVSKNFNTSTDSRISKNLATPTNLEMAENLTISTNLDVSNNCDTRKSLNITKLLDTSTNLEEEGNLDVPTNFGISKNFDAPTSLDITNISDTPTTLKVTNIVNTPTTLNVMKILDTPSKIFDIREKRLISDSLPDTVPQDSFPVPIKTAKISKIFATEPELNTLDLPIEELPEWSLEAAEITNIEPETIDYSSENLPFEGFTDQPILRHDRVLTEAEINSTELQALETVPLDFVADPAVLTSENIDLDNLTSTGVVDSLNFTDEFEESRDEIETSLPDPLGPTIFPVADEIAGEPVSIGLVTEASLRNNDKIDDNIDDEFDDKIAGTINDKIDDNIDDEINDKIDDKITDKINDKIDDKIGDKINDKIADEINEKIDDKIVKTQKSIIIIPQASPALNDSAIANVFIENSQSQEIVPYSLLVNEITYSDTKEFCLPNLSSKYTNDESDEKQNTIAPLDNVTEVSLLKKFVNIQVTESASLKGELLSIESEALQSNATVVEIEKNTCVEPVKSLITVDKVITTRESSKTCELQDKESRMTITIVPEIESKISESRMEKWNLSKIALNQRVEEPKSEMKNVSSVIKESSRNVEAKSKDSHQTRTKDGQNHGQIKKKTSRHHSHSSKTLRKAPLTEKMVEDAISANVVKLVAKPSSKESVMARMIEIDVEIHKLMNEKMTLYKMLESGDFVSEENDEAGSEKVLETTKNVEDKEKTRPPKVLASRLARNLPTPTKHLEEISKRSETKTVNNEVESKTKKRKKSSQRESIKNRGREHENDEVRRERINLEAKIHSRRTPSEETLSLRSSREKSTSSMDLEKKSTGSTTCNSSKSRNEHSSKEDVREVSREKGISSINLEGVEEKRRKRAKKITESPSRNSSKNRNEHSSKEDVREVSREKSISSIDLAVVEVKRRKRAKKTSESPSRNNSKNRNEHSSKEDVREVSREKSISLMDLVSVEEKRRKGEENSNVSSSRNRSKSRNEHSSMDDVREFSREKSISSMDLEVVEEKRRKRAKKTSESPSRNNSKNRNEHSSKEDVRGVSREKSISSIDLEVVEEKGRIRGKKSTESPSRDSSKSRNEHSSKDDVRDFSREKSTSSMDLERIEKKRRKEEKKSNVSPSRNRSKSRNEHFNKKDIREGSREKSISSIDHEAAEEKQRTRAKISSSKSRNENSSKEDIGEGSRDNAERGGKMTKSETVKRERTKKNAKAVDESKKNEEPVKISKLEGGKLSELATSAGRKIIPSGVIYSDESTLDSPDPDSIQNNETRGEKEAFGHGMGLALLEESFKRQMAEQRKAKAGEKRKNKQRELRRALLDPTSLTPDEAQIGLANLLNRKNGRKREISATKAKSTSLTFDREYSGKVWKHVETIIDAVAENRVEQLYNGEAEKSSSEAAATMDEFVEENLQNEREEGDEEEEEEDEEEKGREEDDEKEEENVARSVEKPKDKLDQFSNEVEKGESMKTSSKDSISGSEDPADSGKLVEPEVTTESSSLKESENGALMPVMSETTTALADSGKGPRVDISPEEHTIKPDEVNILEEKMQDDFSEESPNFEGVEETSSKFNEWKAKRATEEVNKTEVGRSTRSRSVSPEYPVAVSTALKKENNEGKDDQLIKNCKTSQEASRDDRIIKIDKKISDKNEVPFRRDKKASRSRSRSSHSAKKRHKYQNENSASREKKSHDRERHDSPKRDQSEEPHDEKSSSRPRSGGKGKQREKAGPPDRRGSRQSEDGGKTSSSKKRASERSNSRGLSPQDGQPSRKKSHQSRRSSSPLAASIDDQTRRRGKKKKRRVELTRDEMASCKVELMDCKYTYLSPNMHPKILKKLGISRINPYVPPILIAENLEFPKLMRNEKTPSPPPLSKAEVAEISYETHEDSECKIGEIDEIRERRIVESSEILRERSSSPEEVEDLKKNVDDDDDDEEEEDDETEDTIHIVKVVDENLPNAIMSDQDEEPDSLDLNAVDQLLDLAENEQTPTEVIAVEEDETIEDDDVEEYEVIDEVADTTDDNDDHCSNANDEGQVLKDKEPPESTEKIVEQEEILESDNDDCVVEARRTRYTVHKGPILDIKVLDDSFLAASEDGAIYRYSQASNGILNIYKGHEAAVTCIHVLEMPGKRWNLYSGSLDGTFRCYDITTGAQDRPPADVGSPIQCMDQAWGNIYVGTKSGHISRYNIKSGSVKGDRLEFSDKSVLALKACTEGPRRVLIVASRNQPITIRDALTGLFLRTVCGYKNHTVYSLLREGNLVYCGTSNTSIPVYNFTNGEQVTQYHAGVGIVCMRLYRQILFAGCYDGNIYVFDTEETKLVCSIPGPGNMLLSMEVVDDEIIAGSKNRQLHSWRMPRQVRALLAKRT